MVKAYNLNTYLPQGVEQCEFQYIRNTEYARYLSEIYGLKFDGLLPKGSKVDENAYLFSFYPLGSEEYFELNVHPDRFWGGMQTFKFPIKCAMHQLVPEPSVIPSNFPENVAEAIALSGITVLGYSCFSKRDLLEAFDLVTNDGYVARLKDSQGSGTEKQYRLFNKTHLRKILKRYDEDYIGANGMILERNVLDPDGSSPPNSYSAGLLDLMGEKYSYIGRLKLGAEGPYGYQGTHLTLFRGGIDGDISADELYPLVHENIRKLTSIIDRNDEVVIGTRLNMDLIYGIYERNDRDMTLDQEPKVYINELATHPGGATGGELSAIKYLRENADKSVARYSSLTDYAAVGLYERNFTRLFCDTLDTNYGRVRVGSLLTSDI